VFDDTDDTDVFAEADPEPRNAPTVSCTRCNEEWSLEYELDELSAGNRAVEQFALDHERHTGHFPDDVTPWIVACERCPAREAFLTERPARRWATEHVRHARHRVSVRHEAEGETETSVIEPESS